MKQPKPKPPTIAQRRCAETWLTRNLSEVKRPELERGLQAARAHPDAQSPGYSRAKAACQRLEAELATRP